MSSLILRADAAVDLLDTIRLVARASLTACRARVNVWFACETAARAEDPPSINNWTSSSSLICTSFFVSFDTRSLKELRKLLVFRSRVFVVNLTEVHEVCVSKSPVMALAVAVVALANAMLVVLGQICITPW